MAEEIQFKLTADPKAALTSLDQLSQAIEGVNEETKKQAEESKKAFGSSSKDILSAAASVTKLEKEYVELSQATIKVRANLKAATDPRAVAEYTKVLAKAEVSLSKMGKGLQAVGSNVKDLNKSASTGKEVFEGFFGTFTKATIILAALQAVAQFAKEVVGFAQNIERAEKQFENFTGSAENAAKTVEGLVALANKKFLNTEEVLNSGKALLAFGESGDNLENVLSRIADISAATGKNFQELSTIYGKARTAGVLYAEDINQLIDAGIPIVQEFAKQLGKPELEIKKLASEGRITFEELQLAFFNLSAEGGKFAGQAEAAAQTFSGAWKKASSDFLTTFAPVGQAFLDFARDVLQGFSLTVTTIQGLFDGLSLGDSIRKANAEVLGEIELSDEDARRIYENNFAERERLEKAAADSRRKSNAKVSDEQKKAAEEQRRAELERDKLRASLIENDTDKAVELERLKFEALTKELRKYFKGTDELNGLILQAQNEFETNVSEIRAKALLAQFDANEASENLRQEQLLAIATAGTEEVEQARKTAEEGAAARKVTALQQIDLAKAQGDAIIIELRRTGKSEDDIRNAQADLDSLDKVSRLTAELKFQQDLLEITGEGDEKRKQAIAAQIAVIQQEIANSVSESQVRGGDGGGIFGNLIDSLGLSEADVASLRDSAARIVGAIQQITAARLADADTALRLAEDRTSEAQRAFDKESELAEAGFASNVTIAKAELEASKVAEAEALSIRKKAAKAQILIDGATQASSLATTAANLIASWSTPTFGVGLIAAFAQIAGIFAFMASVRAKARAASFGEGGEAGLSGDSIVTGPSHSGGGVGIEVEGGEFMTSDGKKISVVNKKMTKKHFALLRAINEDNAPEISRLAADMSMGGASLDVNAGSRMTASASGSKALKKEQEIQALKEQNELLKENNRLLKSIRDKRDGVEVRGNKRIERRGNRTIITG